MKPPCQILAGTVAACILAGASAFSQTVPVSENLWRLAAQEDTDGDRKITIHDQTTPFDIHDQTGAALRTLTNFYQMSVLLQELKRADDQHLKEASMDNLQLDESPVDRTHRFIKEYFWNALTRRIDAAHLDQVVSDSKSAGKYDCLYVPAADAAAVKYFQSVGDSNLAKHRSPELRVMLLPPPDQINGEFVRNLDGAHGLLSLTLETNADGKISGAPYVVPGGRFNELYGWDSYFIVLGLLQDHRNDLARGIADNLLYEVQYYGKIPNANRTYYLTRSQPPF